MNNKRIKCASSKKKRKFHLFLLLSCVLLLFLLNPCSCSTLPEEDDDVDDGNCRDEEEEGVKKSKREALIVCGVDGTVYTLDVWSGSLRGLFTSGAALVSSFSTTEQQQQGSRDKRSSTKIRRETIVPGLDGHLYTLTTSSSSYSDDEDYHDDEVQIDVLPVSVMDVISSPVSTCTLNSHLHTHSHHTSSSSSSSEEEEDEDEDDECGIVLGEKKTQIYAIDPYTGRVQWRQDPSGGGSFTKSQTSFSSSSQKQSNAETVLLQREDYVVRHVTANGGEEVWNVTVGQFSALDFGSSSSSNPSSSLATTSKSNKQQQNKNNKKKKRKKLKQQNTAAAKAASLPPLDSPSSLETKQSKKGLLLPITTKKIVGFPSSSSSSDTHRQKSAFGNTKETSIDIVRKKTLREEEELQKNVEFEKEHNHENEKEKHHDDKSWETQRNKNMGEHDNEDTHEEDEDEEEEEESLFMLPSIAFGEDGTSIIAVDSVTGQILWRRRIESVVAAVYGVGRESGWASLNVVDEQDILRHHYDASHELEAPPSLSSGSGALTLGHLLDDDREAHVVGDHGTNSKQQQTSATTSDRINSLSTFLLPPYPEEEIFSSTTSSSLVPYNQPGDARRHNLPFARLGRHSSTLFIASSSLLPHPTTDSNSFLGHGQHEDDSAALSLWSKKNRADAPVSYPSSHEQEEEEEETQSNESIKTEHGGLFLSWRVVSLLVSLLLGCVAFARMAYIKQKKKWEENSNAQCTPQLVATAPNSREGISAHDLDKNNSTHLLPTHFSLGASKDGEHNLNSTTPIQIRHRLNSVTDLEEIKNSSQNNNTISDTSSALLPRGFKRSMSFPQINGLPLYDQRPTMNSRIQSEGFAKHLQTSSSETPNLASTTVTASTKSRTQFQTETGTDTSKNKSPSSSSAIDEEASQQGKSGEEKETAAAIASPPPGPEQQSSAIGGLVNGMPLVKYSRYHYEFREISALGKGGFGTVFKCSNTLDGREYAVKKIWITSHVDPNNGEAMNQKKLRRVLREVKILALLDHPNIVRYYTAWFELEEKGNGDDEDGRSDTFTSTTDKKLARCFSSELLTVGGPSGPTSVGGGTRTVSQSFRWHSRSSRHQKGGNLPKVKNARTSDENHKGSSLMHINSTNPLGLNNFQSEASLDDSGRLLPTIRWDKSNIGSSSAQGSEEEDLGFNWERSSSGLSDQIAASGLNSEQQNRLSTINDKDENWSLSESSDSSDSGSASTSGDDSSSSSSSSSSSDSDDDLPKNKLHAFSMSFDEQSKENTAISSSDQCKSTNAAAKNSDDAKTSLSSSHKMVVPTSPKDTTKSKQNSNLQLMNYQRYILYIQMQLCSHKTLGDFLSNLEARRGSSSDKTNGVDIPYALRLFSQIARGVKHVHKLGLIHRDLKPSNCFIDEGVVKIGDFGLSRESTTTGGLGEELGGEDELAGGDGGDIHSANGRRGSLGGGEDITAGVGTRSYASPEQMNGSDYDASTDVYSLGVMLFELCYPMTTGMERHTVFSGIRKQTFPDQWQDTVAKYFPSLHTLIMAMLSVSPSERPSADAVANHIDGLLGEYTVLSLDRSHHQKAGSVLLRVEADESDGVLPRTIKLIKDASPDITIMQYGLRGQKSKAIMEFALSHSSIEDDNDDNDDNDDEDNDDNEMQAKRNAIQRVLTKLNESEEIIVVREVTEKHLVMGKNNGMDSSGPINN